VVALVALLFLLPLYWMLVGSLRPAEGAIQTQLEWWPARPSHSSYASVFSLLPLGRYALNSAIVVAVAVPLTLLTASLAGFAISALSPPWQRLILGLSLAAWLTPLMALWLARMVIYRWLGVLDSLAALILPAAFGTSPFYVLILFAAFRRIPRETLEAARLDGCGPARTWWAIGLPLVRPALAAVAVLAFVDYWNSFVEPLLYIHDQRLYTLPPALQALQQLHPSRWSLLMSAAVMITAPVLIAFVCIQRIFFREDYGLGWLGR
jgi:multiple sugar transport system permease protein